MLETAGKVEAFLSKGLRVPAGVLLAERLSGEHKLPRIHVPRHLGALLNVLAGPRVLELGTLGGISTMWFASRPDRMVRACLFFVRYV